MAVALVQPAEQRGAPFLKISNLSKRFGAFAALADISLAVFRGEFMCFLGPSGCGKTTLLRAIAGLDIQSSGTIEQGGRDISRLPVAERDFGIVFQSYALFPNLTVAQNVAYGLRVRRASRAAIDVRVKGLLDLVGLADAGGKYPLQLSGGQQQRVALARALAPEPSLLLLDEPLSALDARVRIHLRGEIKTLQRRLDVTTIMVTHDQEEALTMADRIVVIDQGAIEQIGTPIEIYRSPATPFVARFVGAMNFLPAEVHAPGRVRLGSAVLEALADLSRGVPVTLCIRPEDITVRNVTTASVNALCVHVAEMEFLGSLFRATLVLDDCPETPLLADFSINMVTDLAIDVGTPLTVALPRDRLRVFAGR